jgi:hypothetical protein
MQRGQNSADKIHQPMADHVGYQIAPPKVKDSQDYTRR